MIRDPFPFGIQAEDLPGLLNVTDMRSALHLANYLQRKTQNTELARKLAVLYESMVEQPFPGGIENAFVDRLYPGHWQRSEGAWSWCIGSISSRWRQDHDFPCDFGSQFPAKLCVKQPELIY